VVAQLLPCREAPDSSEVCLHRHLRHGQGNPDAMMDTAPDGVEDTTARILEVLLLGASCNPQEVEESVRHCTKTL
jgi:hypothetical protein